MLLGIICWVLAAYCVFAMCFVPWFNHKTSGEFFCGRDGGPSLPLPNVVRMVLFSFLLVILDGAWSYPKSFQFFLWVGVCYDLVVFIQYHWYWGLLSGIRSRRVRILRANWQKELAEINRLLAQIEKESLVLAGCSQTTLEHIGNHNAGLATESEERKRKLLWKLEHVRP